MTEDSLDTSQLDRIRFMFRARRRIIIVSVVMGCIAHLALAPSADAQRQWMEPAGASEPLLLKELPKPPEDIAALIKTGSVRFLVRGPRPGQTPAPPDRFTNPSPESRSGRQPDATTTSGESVELQGRSGRRWSRGLSFEAETNFTVKIDYQSRCRWQVRRLSGADQVTLRIYFRNIKLKPDHVIWFRNAISPDEFWASPLVQHEFDHVRISTQVAQQKGFAESLRNHSTVTVEVPRGTLITREWANAQTQKLVREKFDQLVELIQIRYEELDRVTRHGTIELPDQSPISEWLRPSNTASRAPSR